jgi:hypothetical protein
MQPAVWCKSERPKGQWCVECTVLDARQLRSTSSCTWRHHAIHFFFFYESSMASHIIHHEYMMMERRELAAALWSRSLDVVRPFTQRTSSLILPRDRHQWVSTWHDERLALIDVEAREREKSKTMTRWHAVWMSDGVSGFGSISSSMLQFILRSRFTCSLASTSAGDVPLEKCRALDSQNKVKLVPLFWISMFSLHNLSVKCSSFF